MPLENLNRARIVQALNRLGQLAEEEGVLVELCLFGGAAMMLAYAARESTKDVDAMVKPTDVAARFARQVATELGLDESWLNREVGRFASEWGTFTPLEIEELESTARRHLKITRPSAGYLLAMKCLACRPELPGHPGDISDLRFLIRKMGIRSIQEVESHLDRFYPHDVLSPQARLVIADLLPRHQGESA
ncbi:MAG TPA: DUF6036 family nucleotidyltransferase [Verrucomicrobiota bacterium]|nr:DUF6036 family nucleotidyltransferase [Verrucomicrobiota bacterium]HNU50461.1 DUF6036 family nucleotidyltransferase [Verrucomicrobiota bacterium]